MISFLKKISLNLLQKTIRNIFNIGRQQAVMVMFKKNIEKVPTNSQNYFELKFIELSWK